MNHIELENLLIAYEMDVRFPDVSGMEHLDMLLTRTRIEEDKNDLTEEQNKRLVLADEQLLQQSGRFYSAIQQVADLTAWRQKIDVPSTQWWWYLDVITFAWPRLRLEMQYAIA